MSAKPAELTFGATQMGARADALERLVKEAARETTRS